MQTTTSKLPDSIIKLLSEANISSSSSPEFYSAIVELYTSLPESLTSTSSFLETFSYLLRPDRFSTFRVVWEDDSSKIRINTAYRCHYSNALGPYKGGLRFSPSVTPSVISFLAFEQTFKNALTGLSLGGAKGGSDFDPKNKSPGEIRRFCKAFAQKLFSIGVTNKNMDTPAGDIGVGETELGVIFGELKRLSGNVPDESLTGKPLLLGGCELRPEATGYGLVYITEEAMKDRGIGGMKDKRVAISGSGNVALFAAEKCEELGGKVITVSDSEGVLYKNEGFSREDIQILKKEKFEKKNRLKNFKNFEEKIENCEFEKGKIWEIQNIGELDIFLPCATQNEVDKNGANKIVNKGVEVIAEGANMPCDLEAIGIFNNRSNLFIPAKAANAGGVSVSGLEMRQNAMKVKFSRKEVDEELQKIMKNIYKTISECAKRNGKEFDLVLGSNLAAFEIVDKALRQEGSVFSK